MKVADLKKPVAPQVDFAKRHLAQPVSYFNAASAIYRLEELLFDAEEISNLLFQREKESWLGSFLEAFSYYKVGFVTCLEWHAKSRLFDLFTYNPNCIDEADIKRGLSSDKIIQMVNQGLTLPQMLAGTISISSLDNYIYVIGRLFNFLEKPNPLSRVLQEETERSGSVGEVLSKMFTNRHELVHEIGINQLGHANIRDYNSFDDVNFLGTLTRKVINAVEDGLAFDAPKDFPNLIYISGASLSEVDILQEKIAEIEDQIKQHSKVSGEESVFFPDEPQLDRVFASAREYLALEHALIRKVRYGGDRYYDVRPYLIAKSLRCRIEYLQAILKQLLENGIEGYIGGE